MMQYTQGSISEKKMLRAVLKKLQKDPCRAREITDNEKESFSTYSHIQRYYPALDIFTIPDSVLSKKNIELPSRYVIEHWNSNSEDQPKIWNAVRREVGAEDTESCKVFTKIVHLLNPMDMIKEKYVCPEHPLLPQSEKTWKQTLLKLHSHNNQAYVDAVANYVLSRFRELDLTPHCILSYGAFTGISKSYQFVISEEYESYRQCRWFWKGMQSHSARLTVVNHTDNDVRKDPQFDEFYKEITTCPFENLDDDSTDSDEEESIIIAPLDGVEEDTTSDVESIHSFTFDNIEEDAENATTIFEINKNVVHHDVKLVPVPDSASESSEHSEESEQSYSDESGSESDYDSHNEFNIDICLETPNMPIILIAQEAQEGVMDHLLEQDDLDGHERGTQGWEARWIAWLFQVIAALTFLQSAICFTHNDLHSNNILWQKTDKKFLYYKINDGTVWKVPTFGKIFRIIDFGRSIFRLGKRLWVSDDHWPDQDAGDQYNFGPFFDHRKPKVVPNPSFDLCRLAVSLIDGLFDEPPSKKKGKNIPVISEEDSWKVYETVSPLYNLLWSWTVNDKGETVYEDKYGNEKYEGFELYIRIAQDVHKAVPKDQLHRPMFKSFIYKQDIPSNEVIYSLGI
jgi:hypothetical protein